MYNTSEGLLRFKNALHLHFLNRNLNINCFISLTYHSFKEKILEISLQLHKSEDIVMY